MLTAEQKQAYTNDGYFTVEEAVPKALIEEIRHEVELITEQKRGGVLAGDYEWWSEHTIPDPVRYQKIIQRLLELPTVMGPVQALIGSDIFLLITDLAIIRAGTGYIAWHQDHGYVVEVLNALASMSKNELNDDALRLLVPVANQAMVFITIYLQDTDNTMGTMRVIPSSHQWEHSLDSSSANSLNAEICLSLPGGAAMFYTPTVWHTAAANTSITDYRMLTLIFTKNNIKPLLVDALKRII
uniref:Phytanoyl-CoA dioxygenase n=1 Tax=Cylindrospermopsis raciborskii T3 TaxID=398006 RepID=B3EYH5_9CYAN|nr:phytanoyl-CoA dioxygenase [Cylindrospermopsis raciborskii T3]